MARLKVLEPEGFTMRQLELAEDRPLVIGRLPDSDLVLGGAGVSRRHCQLVPDGPGYFKLVDLESNQGALVNGASVAEQRLRHGDRILVGATLLVFLDRAEAREPTLEAAIAQHPEHPGPWLVYADWLLENGDPIGDRVVRASRGETVPHADALEGLWAAWSQGAVEIDWQYGFVRRAVVRFALPNTDWRLVVAQLLHLRVSRFMSELWVDLPTLEPWRAAAGQPFPVERWVAELLSAPLPPTLRRLSAGAWGPAPQGWPSVAPPAQALLAQHPGLTGPFFRFVRGAALTPLSLAAGLKLKGAWLMQAVPLTGSQRFWARGKSLTIERSTGPKDDDLGVIEATGSRWFAQPGPRRYGFELNGVNVTETRPLVDGDVLDIGPGLRCRFGLVD